MNSSLVKLQAMMFLMMLIGIVLQKRKIITKEVRKGMTDLVIDVILPCNIIQSFRLEFDMSVLMQFAVIFGVAVCVQLVCWVLGKVLYRGKNQGEKAVLQYGTVCSNAGFMGNPIAEGVYGSQGLMMASVYLVPQRIVMWTAGLSCFTSKSEGSVVKKILTHPCIIAVEIGLALFLFQIPLPGFLGDTVKSISGCNTAMSMILIGSILAEVHIKELLDKTALFYSAVRLAVIPGLALLGCLIFGIGGLVAGVSVLLAAMPAGSTTAILAARYDGDAVFASKCVTLSTVLSLITIPVWCLVLDAVL